MAVRPIFFANSLARTAEFEELDYGALDRAEAQFAAGDFVEAIRLAFTYLFPGANVPDLRTSSYQFAQGSSHLIAEIRDDELSLRVPFVRLPKDEMSRVAAMRYLLTKLTGPSRLQQARLYGDDVYLEYSDKLHRLHPFKVIEVIRQMPVDADANDDVLCGSFGATPIERAPIDSLSADEHRRARELWDAHWQDVDFLLREAQRRGSVFFLNEVTALALFRIQYLVPLHGLLLHELLEASQVFNDGAIDTMKREAVLKRSLRELSARSDEELERSLGHAQFAIDQRQVGTPDILTRYFASGNYMNSVRALHAAGHFLETALAITTSYYGLLTRYAWPEVVRSALTQDLADAAGLSLQDSAGWRDVAGLMLERSNELAASFDVGTYGEEGAGS